MKNPAFFARTHHSVVLGLWIFKDLCPSARTFQICTPDVSKSTPLLPKSTGAGSTRAKQDQIIHHCVQAQALNLQSHRSRERLSPIRDSKERLGGGIANMNSNMQVNTLNSTHYRLQMRLFLCDLIFLPLV